MVQHQDGDLVYWTLPGGGVESNEKSEAAIIREVREETGLDVQVGPILFDEQFNGYSTACRCFLLTETTVMQEAKLGYDPEQLHLVPEARILQGVAWHSMISMANDRQVSQVLDALNSIMNNTHGK